MSKNNFLSGIYPISPIKYDSDYTYLDLVEKALKTNIKIFIRQTKKICPTHQKCLLKIMKILLL